MNESSGPPRRPYTTKDPLTDAKIAEMASRMEDEQDRRLVAELITSAVRLGAEKASTIDLKIINSAVKELRYAFKLFRPYRRVKKVATFGSARVSGDHPAYRMAKEFGRLMAKAGWMVITGAASGIMKAGHEGAGREASFGLNIRLPFEQGANPIIARDKKLISCKYFFTRKLLFIKESHATALFAGGFGTLDEGFESLTLVQTGKSDPRPIVFVDPPRKRFWEPLLDFMNNRLVREGMISPSDRAIYRVARSAEEAADIILKFYSVYHSMRYVGPWMVIRLQRPLPLRTIQLLNREFKDIIVSGEITQGPALDEEVDEPDLALLTRLIFQFNRKDFGRLNQLIGRINQSADQPAR
ncbi:MAG: LOG family protein [Candidatus Omnitrophica bacterium]|nr:LOG family protein [Candidatus Omnitrophota bacterium]